MSEDVPVSVSGPGVGVVPAPLSPASDTGCAANVSSSQSVSTSDGPKCTETFFFPACAAAAVTGTSRSLSVSDRETHVVLWLMLRSRPTLDWSMLRCTMPVVLGREGMRAVRRMPDWEEKRGKKCHGWRKSNGLTVARPRKEGAIRMGGGRVLVHCGYRINSAEQGRGGSVLEQGESGFFFRDVRSNRRFVDLTRFARHIPLVRQGQRLRRGWSGRVHSRLSSLVALLAVKSADERKIFFFSFTVCAQIIFDMPYLFGAIRWRRRHGRADRAPKYNIF